MKRYCEQFLLVLILSLTGLPSPAAIINVVNGGCTLDDAIRAANADAPRGDCSAGSGTDTIKIFNTLPIVLGSSLPTIDTNMTIQGATPFARVSGDDQHRVFDVNGATVTFDNLTIEDGYRCGVGQSGGAGIRVRNGEVSVTGSTLHDNTTCMDAGGGGIFADNSMLTVSNSIFDGNQLKAITVFPVTIRGEKGADISLLDSTAVVSGTSFLDPAVWDDSSQGNAPNLCSGIEVDNSSLSIDTSLFRSGQQVFDSRTPWHLRATNGSFVDFENTTMSAPGTWSYYRIAAEGSSLDFINSTLTNVDLEVTSAGFLGLTNTIVDGLCNVSGSSTFGVNQNNWFSDEFGNSEFCGQAPTAGDLHLLPLEDNGGPSETHALHFLSDAIDAGSNGQCPGGDQRGLGRDANCDIGAYERQFSTDVEVQVNGLLPAVGPYYQGQQLVYGITVSNNGPNPVSGVQVDLSFDNLNVSQVVCPGDPCVFNTLPNVILVRGSPLNGVLGDASVTAVASPAPGSRYTETTPANNSDTRLTLLSPVAELEINLNLQTPPPYVVGQTITYAMATRNFGPDGASNVHIELVPTGLSEFNISNCTVPTGGPCDFAFLANGNLLNQTVNARISAPSFNLVASVSSDLADPFPNNNLDSRNNGGDTETDSDLKLGLDRLTSGPFYNSKVVNYVASVANLGPDIATNTVFDLDFDGLIINGVGPPCVFLPCDLGNIAPNASVDVTFQAEVFSTQGVTVTAFSQSDQTDADPSNNSASDGFTSRAAADLQIFLTPVTQPPYVQGQLLQYTLSVFSMGPDIAQDVLVEVLPQNLSIELALSDNCVSLPCTIPTLASAGGETIDLIARPIDIGNFDLSASVDAVQYDFLPGNNTDNTGNGGFADINPGELIYRDSLESP